MWCPSARSEPERATDDLLLDLGRAAVDGADAAVDERLRDGVLHHVAVAAVQLHRLARELVLQLGRPVLRHRRQRRVELAVEVLADAVVDEDLRDLRLGRHLGDEEPVVLEDRKSTRLNSSHVEISYAVFCLKKKKKNK